MKPNKENEPKTDIIVVLDASGTSIGAVKIYGKNKKIERAELVDNEGKFVQKIPSNITMYQATEILLKKKMGSYTV